MNDLLSIVTLFGGLLGIIAFFWNVLDSQRSFIKLEVSVKNINTSVIVRTKISNSSSKPKKLTSAFLLISPEANSPIESINGLFPDLKANITNDFKRIRADTSIYQNDTGFIPLPFFTSEQVRIGDEDITYAASIDSANFDKKKKYSIRFFVYAKKRLHRSTQDLLVF